MNTKDFIEKAQRVHGDRYDYSKSIYLKYHEKLIISCIKHGDFKQSPYLHLRGSGCSLCYGNRKLTTKDFIEKAQKVHGNKYDYKSTIYNGSKGKLKVICHKHGEFKQSATRHLTGDGCPKCGYELIAMKNKKTTSLFIKDAQRVHGDRYDYSKSIYLGYNNPLIIICPKHGEFKQKPIIHINNSGCPDCGNYSKGEIQIKHLLEKNNIKFERQKLFDDCKGVNRKLPFDFYLVDYNILIEFDGIQHFKPVKRFGGNDGFLRLKKNDEIKNNFTKEKNITLIRIKYNDNIINKLNFLL